MRNRAALEGALAAVLATAPSAHWIKALDDAGVPCRPLSTYAELFADPQIQDRELVVYAEDAELGRVPHIRSPVRMSASAIAVRATAPKLGQHTHALLSGLGYSAPDFDALSSVASGWSSEPTKLGSRVWKK
jgi:glutaryl-CoA transferase